jgi:hypothetical protein
MCSVATHVSTDAEFNSALAIRVAIDAGTSRHTGAVMFQVRQQTSGWPRVTVFGDYHGFDIVSDQNAMNIRDKCMSLTGRGPDVVRLDPAASARTSLGPIAFGEYARVLGERITSRWPLHGVADGLDQIELLLGGEKRETNIIIHPRCTQLIGAFQTCRREEPEGNTWTSRRTDNTRQKT